jgi:hypothetical protein
VGIIVPDNGVEKYVNVQGNQTGLFRAVRAELVLKSVGGLVITAPTFHPVMFWLNAVALKNMAAMFPTAPVFHAPIGWLNPFA